MKTKYDLGQGEWKIWFNWQQEGGGAAKARTAHA